MLFVWLYISFFYKFQVHKIVKIVKDCVETGSVDRSGSKMQ